MTVRRNRRSQPATVASLLGQVFTGRPLERRLKETVIWQVWDRTVGRQIAAKARPAAFRDGILTVAVSNAPWMQQLSFMKNDIRDRLNAAAGEELVRDIFLKAGSMEKAKAEPPPRKRAVRPLTAAEKEWIAQETASITDPELRAALADLMAASMAAGGR